MASYLVVLGLFLALLGSALLIWDEMLTDGAQIKSHDKKLRGNFLKQIAFFVARWFGSSNPMDRAVLSRRVLPEEVLGVPAPAVGVSGAGRRNDHRPWNSEWLRSDSDGAGRSQRADAADGGR